MTDPIITMFSNIYGVGDDAAADQYNNWDTLKGAASVGAASTNCFVLPADHQR